MLNVFKVQNANLVPFFGNHYHFYALSPLVKAELITVEQIEKKKKEKNCIQWSSNSGEQGIL